MLDSYHLWKIITIQLKIKVSLFIILKNHKKNNICFTEINSHSMALVLSILLSVTMSGAFVFVLQREMKRRRNPTP